MARTAPRKPDNRVPPREPLTPNEDGLFLVDASKLNHMMQPGKASEMAHRRNETYKERRAAGSELSKARREEAVNETRGEVDKALASSALDGQPIESLADQLVFRTLKILLLAGDAFLPLTAKECIEQATALSKIAASETNRRRGKTVGEAEPEPVLDHRATLAAVHRRMRDRARERALAEAKPG